MGTTLTHACALSPLLTSAGATVDYTNDGHCDDGMTGASFAVCNAGTDCADCGPRTVVG